MEKTSQKIIVVAAPGFNCIVNIGGRTLTIDAYNPVNLSAMFDINTIKKCSSLSDHLSNGTLKYFNESDELPESTNNPKITSLRAFETGSSLTATFDQKTVGTIQSTETTAKISKSVKEELKQQIDNSQKKSITAAQEAKQRVRDKYLKNDSDRKPYSGNDMKPVDPKLLIRPVTTDIPLEEFKKRQEIAAESRKELMDTMMPAITEKQESRPRKRTKLRVRKITNTNE